VPGSSRERKPPLPLLPGTAYIFGTASLVPAVGIEAPGWGAKIMQGGGGYCNRRMPAAAAAGGATLARSPCRRRRSSPASADHQLAGTRDSRDSQLRVSPRQLARHEGRRTARPRARSSPAALAIACRRMFRAPQARVASRRGSAEQAAAAGAHRKCFTIPPLLGLHGLSDLGSGGRAEQNQGSGRSWSSKKALPQVQGGGNVTPIDRAALPPCMQRKVAGAHRHAAPSRGSCLHAAPDSQRGRHRGGSNEATPDR
jgi:hypothetical protein